MLLTGSFFRFFERNVFGVLESFHVGQNFLSSLTGCLIKSFRRTGNGQTVDIGSNNMTNPLGMEKINKLIIKIIIFAVSDRMLYLESIHCFSIQV